MKKIFYIFLILPFLISPLFAHASGVVTDGFETYSTGSLIGQGGWYYGSGWTVENSVKHSGSQAIEGTYGARSRNTGTAGSGTGSFWFYIANDSTVGHDEMLDILLLDHAEHLGCGYFGIISPSGTTYYALMDDHSIHITQGAWHLLSFSYTSSSVSYWLDGGTPVNGNCWGEGAYDIDQYRLDVENNGTPHFYVDDFGSESAVGPVFSVTDPASSEEDVLSLDSVETTQSFSFSSWASLHSQCHNKRPTNLN